MSSSRKSNEGLTSLSNTPCSFTLSENPETASGTFNRPTIALALSWSVGT